MAGNRNVNNNQVDQNGGGKAQKQKSNNRFNPLGNGQQTGSGDWTQVGNRSRNNQGGNQQRTPRGDGQQQQQQRPKSTAAVTVVPKPEAATPRGYYGGPPSEALPLLDYCVVITDETLKSGNKNYKNFLKKFSLNISFPKICVSYYAQKYTVPSHFIKKFLFISGNGCGTRSKT